MSHAPSGARFPKEARLLRRADFTFTADLRWKAGGFLFLARYAGQGRLGVSIAKKVLRRAVERNRVRRLLREAFRQSRERFSTVDIHVIGQDAAALRQNAEGLALVRDLLARFGERLDRARGAS